MGCLVTPFGSCVDILSDSGHKVFVTSPDPEALEMLSNLRFVRKPRHYLTIHGDLKNRITAGVTGTFKSIS